MWAEARKQEKKVRGIMVDHKKRAERRREYYEKIVRFSGFPISFFFSFLIRTFILFLETRSCSIFTSEWTFLQVAH